MPVVNFDTDDGNIQMVITGRCLICGHETDSYLEARQHVDLNAGHFYASIVR
jgi:hypothetical protein